MESERWRYLRLYLALFWAFNIISMLLLSFVPATPIIGVIAMNVSTGFIASLQIEAVSAL